MKHRFSLMLTALVALAATSCAALQKADAAQTDISVTLNADNTLKVTRKLADAKQDVIFPSIKLGIDTDKGTFDVSKMKLTGQTKPVVIKEKPYTAVSGKKSLHTPEWNEFTLSFARDDGRKMDVIVRTAKDGFAFRYALSDKKDEEITFLKELTEYTMPQQSGAFAQRGVTSYEDYFPYYSLDKMPRQKLNYPLLMHTGNRASYALITESGVDGTYCNTRLNSTGNGLLQVVFPDRGEGAGQGKVEAVSKQPWKSPWRTVILGDLGDIVESTMIDDLADPCKIADTSWIHPGTAAWVYWAYNHGSKDFKIVKQYIDLAAEMHWRYVLIDWEWDVMSNGGNIDDAIKYAHSKNVEILLWYNSGGKHNYVSGGPRDRLLTHEDRIKEFRWLKEKGVSGIKVDFFESDKQDMVNYYLDILKDAAAEKFLINFHGCTIPRGWSRTYPNLVSMEAVYGAEQYNNGGSMTNRGADHNTMLVFTRNVVGPMDYTPIAFTDSQHKHTTGNAHELALGIVFESTIQHMADRPSSFLAQPDKVKKYLSEVPTAWDETRFLAGDPNNFVVLARRKGDTWYIAGINGSAEERTFALDAKKTPFDVKKNWSGIQFTDGADMKSFVIKEGKLPEMFPVKMPKKGGFVVVLKPAK